MEYEEAYAKVSGALKFGIEPSLEGIRLLTEQLGNPQGTFASIQVAGTNGKSSTVRFLAALLHAEGLHVGLYTSPDLVDYTERFEVDGKVMPHDAFAHHVTRVLDAADAIHARMRAQGVAPASTPQAINHAGEVVDAGTVGMEKPIFTEFEYLTAVAFDYFAAEHVDVAVLEVGLGGRWDSTSIVHPKVAVITGIGLDHMKILGDTVEQIAGEKAAIIRSDSAVVLGPGTADTQQVFLDRIASVGAGPVRTVCPKSDPGLFPSIPARDVETFEVTETSPRLVMDVDGCLGAYRGVSTEKPSYQAENIATAICAAEAFLSRPLDEGRLREAVASCPTPGRYETLRKDPLLIIDAAHNPQSAEHLAKVLGERFPADDDGKLPLTLLLAILEDKDARGIIGVLAPLFSSIVVTQTISDRALDASELALMVEEVSGVKPRAITPLPTALEVLAAEGADVIATGSITTAGQVKALFV